MKKCLFIGHEYHKRTLSNQFFIDTIKDYYHIEYLWTNPFRASLDIVNNEKILQKSFDVIFFWQIMISSSELDKFKTRNIILIPMYDNDLSITYDNWKEYNKYKFLLFSKSLYKKLKYLGNKNLIYTQYAPKKIISNQKKSKKINLFFWQRKSYMNFEYLKQIIDLSKIDSIHIHSMNNNFHEYSKKDIKTYNITFSNWFETKQEYYDLLKWCDIFIAPRFYEGIGMGFLEAMAMGKCVIAADFPTMNEYIKNNYNGLLFNATYPHHVDISKHKKIGLAAQQTINKIYKKWKKEQKNILIFIEKKSKKSKKNIYKSIKDNKLSFFYDDLNIINSNVTKSYIFTHYLNQVYIFLQNFTKTHQKIIIYGFGTGTKAIIDTIIKQTIFIVDKDINKQKIKYKGLEIKPISKLSSNNYPIIISVFNRGEIIKKELIEKYNIKSKRIIILDINSYGF